MTLEAQSQLEQGPLPLAQSDRAQRMIGKPVTNHRSPTCPVLDAQGCQAGHQTCCQKCHQYHQPLLHRGPSCPAPLTAPGAAEVHLQGRRQEGWRDHEPGAPLPQKEGALLQTQTLGRHQAALLSQGWSSSHRICPNPGKEPPPRLGASICTRTSELAAQLRRACVFSVTRYR